MPVKVIDKQIEKAELADLELKGKYASLIKAVVDIKRKMMIAGVSMNSNAEELLLEDGSEQFDLWGINLYLKESYEEWIEYDSVINLRPSQGNNSRGVDDPEI